MKHRIYVFALAFLLLAITIPAQTAKVAKPDDVKQTLRKDIEYLASDKLEGRRTGEQGATLAASYIAQQFLLSKLKGIPGKKPVPYIAGFVPISALSFHFLQPFPYVIGVAMAKTGNEFKLEFTSAQGGRMKIENLLPVKPVGFSPNAAVENAPVVFAGFGITSSDLKFDDYANLDAKGKIVLIFDGVPDNDNPHSAFNKFDVRTKALIAKDKGAVGMLLISREDKFEDDKLTRLGYDQTLGEAALPTFIMSRNTAANILGVKEGDLKMIEGFTAAKATPGATTHVNVPDTQPIVSFSVNLEKKSVNAFNVIGILPGTDPKLKNEAIIIGAHYDHLGHGGQGSLDVNSTAIHHGADDNASGTAAILELAREFAREKKNKRTLIFIAFSGEEEGLIGSKYYVNNPVFPLEKTVAMINLDMVGRLKDQKLTIGGIGTASEWKDVVNAKNEFQVSEGLPGPRQRNGVTKIVMTPTMRRLKFNLQLNEDGFGPSDHSSFYGKKIPVLFFFTGTHEDYHKPSDTADKINYDGLEDIVSYVADLTRAIDQNQQRPTYTVAKSSGIGGGRSGFNISLGTVPSYVDSTDGLVLDGVRDNSPAAKAGLKPGDKVVKLAGKDVRNVMDYTYILGEMKAGEEYEIVVIRGGERVTMTIIPVKR